MAQNILPGSIVPDLLRGQNNYREWSHCVKNYLVSQGLWDNIIIEGISTESLDNQHASHHDAVSSDNPDGQQSSHYDAESDVDYDVESLDNPDGPLSRLSTDCDSDSSDNSDRQQSSHHDAESPDKKQARDASDDDAESSANQQATDHDEDRMGKNATALHVILVTCAPNILRQLKITDSAKIAWDLLAEFDGKRNDNLGALLKYAYRKDWQSMESFLKDNPAAVNKAIKPWRQTALHVAVTTNNLEMVKKLVDLMTPKALEIKDTNGTTAFDNAATRGQTEAAKYMFQKNRRLPEILSSVPGSTDKWLPITYAARHNHKEMSAYLLSITHSAVLRKQDGIYASRFLEHSIKSRMLDIALKALNDHPWLVAAKRRPFAKRRPGVNALLLSLSATPGIFLSSVTVELGYWQRWIYSRIHIPSVTGNVDRCQSQPQSTVLHRLVRNFHEFLGINEIYDLKKMHAYSSQLLDHACEYVSELDGRECDENGITEAFFYAIKFGIYEIIDKIIETQPRLLQAMYGKKDRRNLVMLSIVHRHDKIFSRWHNLIITTRVDKSMNTLLHLAGMLSPSSVLTSIPGAALQMQRELQWYKEVERIVNPATKFKLNKNGETPEQVFSKSHKQLVKDGEKWMKGTATSYTVVAALIITVTFAAAFTVPGGNVQDIGIPVFLHKKAFETFILADAISLFSASTSALMFLGILTSRYAEQDFLKSLPTKLIIGISMLFISITAMMVAFCSALIATLRGKLEVIILIVVLACVPVILFMSLQLPLLLVMVKSTYGSGIFDRKKKT